MNLTVFRSGKGDSLLLGAQSGAHILVDGGISSAYSAHVAPALGQLAAKKKALDLVYVSHIDSDHIGGVLRMLDDEVDWRVHDFQVKSGNTSFPKPKSERPPKIKKIWHNAFRDQVEKNLGEIESLLVNQIRLLGFDEQLRREVDDLQDLVASERQALLVSNRVSERQLDIPLNPEFDGRGN